MLSLSPENLVFMQVNLFLWSFLHRFFNFFLFKSFFSNCCRNLPILL